MGRESTQRLCTCFFLKWLYSSLRAQLLSFSGLFDDFKISGLILVTTAENAGLTHFY